MTSAFALVLTGPLARWLGRRVGLPHEGETLWAGLKWPVLLCLVACLIMVLFSTGPRSARELRHLLDGEGARGQVQARGAHAVHGGVLVVAA
ncbi:hypothetical protein SMICM17S_11194 [Streptomyces microflavus]